MTEAGQGAPVPVPYYEDDLVTLYHGATRRSRGGMRTTPLRDVEFVPPERITVLICPRCGSITHRAKGERGRLCGCKLRTTRCIEAHYTLALYEQNGGTDGG